MECFKEQIDYYSCLTDDILDKIEFRLVWSGKRMVAGDKVLYAYVYEKGTDNLKMITFLERELHEMDRIFEFIDFHNDTFVPILVFRDDTKIRK